MNLTWPGEAEARDNFAVLACTFFVIHQKNTNHIQRSVNTVIPQNNFPMMIGSNYNIQYPPGSSSALHGCLPHHQSPHYVLPLPFLLLFRSCSPSLELPVFVLLYVRFVSMFLLFSAMVPFCFDEGGTSSLSSS